MANVTLIDGHVPNYVDPETQVPLILGIQISLTATALVVVALRLYTRKYIRNVLTIEDWVAAASMVLCFFSTLVSCLGILGGTGLHYYDIPPGTDTSIAAATSFANQTFYQPMLQLTRISMLLFYLTCLGKETRMTCIGLIVLSALFGVACTVVEFLQCSPTSMLWTGVRPATYKCIDQPQFFRISGLINLILDLIVLGLPISVFWKLNIPKRAKAALCGIFSVGIISIGAEIMRLVIWYNINDGNRQSKDSSWNRVTMINVSCVEYTTAIICASLPHLKALASTIIPGYFDSAIRSLRDKRQSTRFSRLPGSMRLGGSNNNNNNNNSSTNNTSTNNTNTTKSLSSSQNRRSAQQPAPGAVVGLLNLDGRRASLHGHSSVVEAGPPSPATLGPSSSGGGDNKLGQASWLADSGSEEYILGTVAQPGEIWKKTEVEVRVGSAASYGGRRESSRGPDSPGWPL